MQRKSKDVVVKEVKAVKPKAAKKVDTAPPIETEKTFVPVDIPKPPKAFVRATPKRTVLFIANPTAGDIIIPRPGRGGLKASALVFPAGKSVQVDAVEWRELKGKTGLLNYIDQGMLVEVIREGDVMIVREASGELAIPDFLQDIDADVPAKNSDIKANVRRKDLTHIPV